MGFKAPFPSNHSVILSVIWQHPPGSTEKFSGQRVNPRPCFELHHGARNEVFGGTRVGAVPETCQCLGLKARTDCTSCLCGHSCLPAARSTSPKCSQVPIPSPKPTLSLLLREQELAGSRAVITCAANAGLTVIGESKQQSGV